MLKQDFEKNIIPDLKKRLNLDNNLAVPRIEKVVISMGVGEAKDNQQLLDSWIEDLSLITGQRPVICRAKKSVSGFKLRKNDPVGLKVTLRGRKMYDFLERLFNLVLPRLRDFRGLSAESFDREGNFNIGIPDQLVFPEVDVDKVKKQKGLQVTIVTNTKDIKKARLLLELMGLPFIS
jgi:large subunit ribosomal protein L5